MDSFEATRTVYSRIQNLDPENASKIMGYILILDHGEKEMIRLAFGPEALIRSLILKAKSHLGLSLSSTPNSNPVPLPTPFSRPTPLTIPSPSSSSSSNTWSVLNHCLISPNASDPSVSYAGIVNGNGSSGSLLPCNEVNEFNVVDDYHLSFLNDSNKPEDFLSMSSPTTGANYADSPLHRRSFSVPPGLCFEGAEDLNSGVGGWKPCLYFARGFCKNGTGCRFVHGDDAAAAALVGSPTSNLSEFEQCQELLRSKALLQQQQQQQQQQKLAAASQLLAASASFPYSKCAANYLLQQNNNDTHRSAAAALMLGDELQNYGRCRPERNDFSAMGLGAANNPGSRQIYLTFPADSTFKEEDVSNYFSIYGPVQDVRIPYQQKRMFGFVTFVYSDTVKLILAKGNPHFVCDSRVLVKPYKEKGKVQEKKQQQLERGEYSMCSSPTALESRDPFDLQLGARMFYNTQEMLLRRKLEEQADLQQAIELQGRRLMNLQMMDLKNHHHHSQFHHGLSSGSSPIPSPTVSYSPNNQALIFPVDGIDQEVVPEENGGSLITVDSKLKSADAGKQLEEVNPVCNHENNNGNSNGYTVEKANTEENGLPESLEHILPDNLFASPKNSAGAENLTVFSASSGVADGKTTNPTSSCSNGNISLANTSTLNMASLKSCFLQMPSNERLSSGQETIGM